MDPGWSRFWRKLATQQARKNRVYRCMRSNIFDICYEKSICINKHVCMILIYIYIYSRQQDMSTYTLGPQTKKYNEMLYILSWFAIPLWSDIYIYIIYMYECQHHSNKYFQCILTFLFDTRWLSPPPFIKLVKQLSQETSEKRKQYTLTSKKTIL